jgi:hypothetical protein
MRLEVRLGRPDVEPEAGQREPVHRAFRTELWEHLPFDRDRAIGGDQIEDARLEHVEARVDQVRVDLLGSASRGTTRPCRRRRAGRGRSDSDRRPASADRRLRPGRAVKRESASRSAPRSESPLRRRTPRSSRAANPIVSTSPSGSSPRPVPSKPAVGRTGRSRNLSADSRRRHTAAGHRRRRSFEGVCQERPTDEREHVLFPCALGQGS